MSTSLVGVMRRTTRQSLVERWSTVWPPGLALALALIMWQALPPVLGLPHYIFPKPTDVLTALILNWSDYIEALQTTAVTAIAGFLLSAVIGVGCAVVMASFRTVEKIFYPYAIVLNTVPIIAIAPLIVIWFGAGARSSLVITFIISFFPILTNTVVGLRSASANSVDLFRVYHASKWQMMLKLRIPSALPFIMTGLKIACTLAVVGTIVGEYVGGAQGAAGGLGYIIILASQQFETPYVFVVAATTAFFGILFYLAVNLVSIRVLSSWHESAMAVDS